MVEGLQTQVEELHRDMQKLKLDSAEQTRSSDPDGVQGLTCCEDNSRLHNYVSHEPSVSTSRSSLKREEQDEYWELKRSVDSLQAQLNTERALRQTAELEADALVHELSQLEPKVALLGVYKERLAETEAEAQELRLLLRSSEDNLFHPLDAEVGVAVHRGRSLQHSRQLLSEEHPAVKHHGISLLNEVDAQYTALQEKYDTLLRRCQGGMCTQKQKNGQTHTHSPGVNTQNDSQQPEYKALFQEIFTFIQKSKKDLKENRVKPGQVE